MEREASLGRPSGVGGGPYACEAGVLSSLGGLLAGAAAARELEEQDGKERHGQDCDRLELLGQSIT